MSGNENVWPHLVTEGLRQRLRNVMFDYDNGGVPGYTVSSSLRNLEYRVAPLEPDVIVIYHATNDMSGDLRELAVRQGLIRDARFDPESWLSRNSLLWDLAQKNFRVLMAQNDAKRQVGRLEVDPTALGEAFRRNLTSLARASRERARVVAIATFSTQLRSDQSVDAQLRAAASALYNMPFMSTEGLIAAYARYNEIIRDVAATEGAVLNTNQQSASIQRAHTRNIRRSVLHYTHVAFGPESTIRSGYRLQAWTEKALAPHGKCSAHPQHGCA